MNRTVTTCVGSPLGPLALRATGRGLCELRFGGTPTGALESDPILAAAAHWLSGHFRGERSPVDFPLDLSAGTRFQTTVWRALLDRVGPGRVVTYGELATLVGRPRAARAIGQAMNRNPVPIVVPCHRVVAAGGQLGGFGPGLDLKRALLRLEGVPA